MGVYLWTDTAYIPTANTLAYFPFNTDQLDKVWSVTIQATGTKQTLWFLFDLWSSNLYFNNLSDNAKFVSFWVKFWSVKSWGNNQTVQMKTPQMFYSYYNVTSSFNQRFAYYNGSWHASNQATTTSWTWYYFAYGYTGTNVVAYINWNQILNVATSTASTTFEIWRNINQTLSELIFETQVWTAQEIQDYYNKTKSNYWL